MASTADIRNGVVLNMDGGLWTVIEFQHVKPGKGGAFVRTKVKNVRSGKTIDRTFNAGAKVEIETVDRSDYQYLYKDGDGYVFMNAADYDQIELRLMAHLSGDEAMLQAFRQGQDIHDFTARQIFQLEHQAVTAQQRRVAKSVNFGLLYGMSDFGLAARLGISRSEAKAMTTAYFARFPSVRSYILSVIEGGREKGYVSTLLGRRRAMPALRSSNYMQRAAAEREATNAPIQGSAADLMKLAMVRIRNRMGAVPARMLLQIHDELIFEVQDSALHELAVLVKHEMENALQLSVAIAVSLKSGPNWYEVTPLQHGNGPG